MVKKNGDEFSRSDHKTKHVTMGSLVLRSIILVFLLCLLGTVSYGAYEYHALIPSNHFKHLEVIGASPKSGKAAGPSHSAQTEQSGSPSTPQVKQKTGVFNVLLIGSDAKPGDQASHTDSMLLIRADMNNHTYHVLSIPRDTRVYMKGYGYTKLTSVQFISQVHNGEKQGIIDAVKAISNLTGVPINYYAETNYIGLQDMVDAIGGITMDVPFDVTFTHPWYKKDGGIVIKKGDQNLNGKMLTEIVHERDSLPGTDYGRQKVQEAALMGIAQKVMQPTNVTKLPALSRALSKFLVATNMTTSDMLSIALGVKSDFHPSQQIHYHQVKGKTELVYDDILKAKNDEIILDHEQLQRVISQFFKS